MNRILTHKQLHHSPQQQFQLAPLIVLFILLIGIYIQIIATLVETWWNDANYSHGFLIPIVSIYLIWMKREQLRKIEMSSSNPGLILFIIGLLMYVLGVSAAEYFSAGISFIVVLFGMVLFLCGRKMISVTWFPILFLVFMVPIPYVFYYALTFPMQLLSTQMAALLLQFIGFPILSQGNIIHLPNYSLEVVEACSGLRSLMTLTALGALMAYLTQRTLLGGLTLFCFSAPIAIGANIFRIFISALGAVLISPEFAEGFLHKASGVVVFLVGFIALGFTGMVINWFVSFKKATDRADR